VNIHIFYPNVFVSLNIPQDTKKKKREPKAGSAEDWETEAQSVSLGQSHAAWHVLFVHNGFCLLHMHIRRLPVDIDSQGVLGCCYIYLWRLKIGRFFYLHYFTFA
jgi:hypothetical protein